MDLQLSGKHVLITGASMGIGAHLAETFAAEKAHLHLTARSTDKLEALKERIIANHAVEVTLYYSDLAQPGACAALSEAVGSVDILVNNAGIQKTVSLKDLTRDTWDAIIAVNLSGALHTMSHALPNMAERGYGRVINIASVHGLVASKDKAPYVAAKFGLVGLSKVAALEYAHVGSKESGGVTVNCICPGWTDTPLIEPQIMARAEKYGGDREAGKAELVAEKQPSTRTADPSEIGALAVWLCAPIAHNVTGTSIPIDGGWTAQ